MFFFHFLTDLLQNLLQGWLANVRCFGTGFKDSWLFERDQFRDQLSCNFSAFVSVTERDTEE